MRAVQLQPGEKNYCAEFHIAVSFRYIYSVPENHCRFRLPTHSPAVSSSVAYPSLYLMLLYRRLWILSGSGRPINYWSESYMYISVAIGIIMLLGFIGSKSLKMIKYLTFKIKILWIFDKIVSVRTYLTSVVDPDAYRFGSLDVDPNLDCESGSRSRIID